MTSGIHNKPLSHAKVLENGEEVNVGMSKK
jgi:hypothetical protein